MQSTHYRSKFECVVRNQLQLLFSSYLPCKYKCSFRRVQFQSGHKSNMFGIKRSFTFEAYTSGFSQDSFYFLVM